MLASHLENRFQHHKAISTIGTEVRNTIDLEYTTVQVQLKFTTPKEIKNCIRNLPHRKSPGEEDMIPNIVLKNLNIKATLHLVNIFNGCLRLNYFPKSRKNGIVINIHRSGKPKNATSNCRPISLLDSISKLFVKVLHKRITQFIQDTPLILQHQFGFRQHHSTILQLQRVAEYIVTGFQSKKYTAAAFLDVSAAFLTTS
jgi:hypothetical protein